MVELLLCEEGVIVNYEGIDYETPLSFACKHSKMTVVNLLLSNKSVDPNWKRTDDRTLRSLAVDPEEMNRGEEEELVKHDSR